MDKILTVNDVADVLQVKPMTVREMFRTERIRGFKVGKSWRTTEKMLQEDIEKLARGEAPDKLPKNSNGTAPHKTAKAEKPARAPKTKAAKAKPKPAPEAEVQGHENGHAAPAPKTGDDAEDPEVAQQFLF